MKSIERVESPPPLPPRPLDGHKGLFGRLLIVGGSKDMIGAPILAGTAALRTGAGLVQVAMPRAVLAQALSVTPELIGLGLAKSRAIDDLLEAAQKADAIVIGPGLGQQAGAKQRLKSLLRLQRPMVLDADALNILAAGKKWPADFHAQAVLTPHPGEMSRLGKLLGQTEVPADDQGRIELAVRAAGEFGQVMVLKGHRTVVTDGQRVYVNQTGDSTLSKAGTGDVLSGVLGCLLAQKIERFDAACMAVHLHGLAGEIAGEECGRRSALAREIIDALEAAIAQVEHAAGE